jgi:hypothetical protein
MEHLYRCLRRLALVTPFKNGDESQLPGINDKVLTNVNRKLVEHDYAILLTAASPGSIPADVWRTSHVIYL